ncbi:DUF3667 domain-containing protein [Fulvivirga sedimenti]|uniref:DUF3667 domain-containing protein n=1 Tax=Fulvivirga sedimenti TaxID=2879465 RepID=A0A9X1KZV8_9BACT|nr:DUF3667 domain-containing protein [Fulvivirga sedimenti]MCA6075430.1 DUF3667 domain-containing protein [Fulvivirga sedimenti]MCA6076607.1 DUF3667 domain-containing protein [Fulvivirga sedimenti]MCA6077735.1 DUF3667 domain-containing protein [Fulvivirga sedimenti]
MHNCINCGKPHEYEYCPWCTQKKVVGRLSFRVFFDDLQDKLIGFDFKFSRTFLDLFYRPATVAKSYIAGNRVRYVGPVGYYFVMLTILVLLITIMDVDMIGYTRNETSFFQQSGLTPEQIEQQESMQGWIYSNFKFASFFFFPFFLFATALLFRKSKFNLLETSVLVLYSLAHSQVFNYFSITIFKFTGISFSGIVTGISMLYTAFFAMDFYRHNKRIHAFIKGLLIYPLGLLFLMIFLLVVLFILVLIFPERMRNFLILT